MITNLTAYKAYGASSVSVTWDAEGEFIDHFEITYSNNTYTIAGSARSYNANIAQNAQIVLKAVDIWGQEVIASTTAVYQPAPPVINSFTAGYYNAQTNVHWNITGTSISTIVISWGNPSTSVSVSELVGAASLSANINVTLTLTVTDTYGRTATATTNSTDMLPIVNPSSKDIGVKFGMTAPVSGRGYTPTLVTAICTAINRHANMGQLAGNFAVGDYFDLDTLVIPTVNVLDAKNTTMEVLAESYTNVPLTNAYYIGYTEGAQLRFHIESVDGYYGKNGNNHHHLVFRSWAKFNASQSSSGTDHRGRINNNATATGGYPACGANRYLNNFFASAMAQAGVPSSVILSTARRVSTSQSSSQIHNAKFFLATEWEERGTGPSTEGDGTQIRFETTMTSESYRKVASVYVNSLHWLASSVGGELFIASSGVLQIAAYAFGYAPTFCIG
jgi:hypothetical protein